MPADTDEHRAKVKRKAMSTPSAAGSSQKPADMPPPTQDPRKRRRQQITSTASPVAVASMSKKFKFNQTNGSGPLPIATLPAPSSSMPPTSTSMPSLNQSQPGASSTSACMSATSTLALKSTNTSLAGSATSSSALGPARAPQTFHFSLSPQTNQSTAPTFKLFGLGSVDVSGSKGSQQTPAQTSAVPNSGQNDNDDSGPPDVDMSDAQSSTSGSTGPQITTSSAITAPTTATATAGLATSNNPKPRAKLPVKFQKKNGRPNSAITPVDSSHTTTSNTLVGSLASTNVSKEPLRQSQDTAIPIVESTAHDVSMIDVPAKPASNASDVSLSLTLPATGQHKWSVEGRVLIKEIGDKFNAVDGEIGAVRHGLINIDADLGNVRQGVVDVLGGVRDESTTLRDDVNYILNDGVAGFSYDMFRMSCWGKDNQTNIRKVDEKTQEALNAGQQLKIDLQGTNDKLKSVESQVKVAVRESNGAVRVANTFEGRLASAENLVEKYKKDHREDIQELTQSQAEVAASVGQQDLRLKDVAKEQKNASNVALETQASTQSQIQTLAASHNQQKKGLDFQKKEITDHKHRVGRLERSYDDFLDQSSQLRQIHRQLQLDQCILGESQNGTRSDITKLARNDKILKKKLDYIALVQDKVEEDLTDLKDKVEEDFTNLKETIVTTSEELIQMVEAKLESMQAAFKTKEKALEDDYDAKLQLHREESVARERAIQDNMNEKIQALESKIDALTSLLSSQATKADGSSDVPPGSKRKALAVMQNPSDPKKLKSSPEGASMAHSTIEIIGTISIATPNKERWFDGDQPSVEAQVRTTIEQCDSLEKLEILLAEKAAKAYEDKFVATAANSSADVFRYLRITLNSINRERQYLHEPDDSVFNEWKDHELAAGSTALKAHFNLYVTSDKTAAEKWIKQSFFVQSGVELDVTGGMTRLYSPRSLK